jgi:hypothetical protein
LPPHSSQSQDFLFRILFDHSGYILQGGNRSDYFRPVF